MDVLEFFAGIGLARKGMESPSLRSFWSTDISHSKACIYRSLHTSDNNDSHFIESCILSISVKDLPSTAQLAWASFPCQDFSTAGKRRGFTNSRANTFWKFIDLIDSLKTNKPNMIIIENVPGLISSNKGSDIISIIKTLNYLGYTIDILNIDAKYFLPQSRPRIFIIGILNFVGSKVFHSHQFRPPSLHELYKNSNICMHTLKLPAIPHIDGGSLTHLLSETDHDWWSKADIKKFTDSLSPINKRRLVSCIDTSEIISRTAYRRTRNGLPVWEIRNDSVAGCLRALTGGSSKQALVQFSDNSLKVRWLNEKDYSLLMGVDPSEFTNLAVTERVLMSALGEAVVVPVVEWLNKHYIQPILKLYN